MGYFKLTSVAALLSIVSLFSGAQSVWALTCMNDNFNNSGKKGNLVCTAKEVFIAEGVCFDAEGIKLHKGECAAAELAAGAIFDPEAKIIDAMVVGGDGCLYPYDKATVDIIADIHFNADRFDVGVYSALDGGDALFGTCDVDPMPLEPSPAIDLDGNPDICGDVITGGGGADLADFAFQELTLTCEDTDDDGFLDFSVCFSWRTSGNNDLCQDDQDIFPGTKSKCFCERVNIPVPVPAAELNVVKTASPESVTEPGGTVTFRVEVTNTGVDPNNNVTLNSLSDDIYNDITTTEHDGITAVVCLALLDCHTMFYDIFLILYDINYLYDLIGF